MKKWHFLVLLMECLPICVYTLPKGENIIHGKVAFQRLGPQLSISQDSPQAIIHWDEFSIKQNEITRFIQPSKDASVLNRVIGNNLSAIYGSLESNGKVYLINHKGIVVGPEGRIKTASFIASTLDILDDLFLSNQNLNFVGTSDEKLINYGTIEAIDGDIVLFAKVVENHGTLRSPNGAVLLGAGSDLLLGHEGDERIFVRPSLDGMVVQDGSIEGVKVELRAAGGNHYSLALNVSGNIDATGFVRENGKIILTADSGETHVAATIKGNSVKIIGDQISLSDDALIDVSNPLGGGEVYIGGGFQGNDPLIRNANALFIDETVQIKADALDQGNGGKVILWGTNANQFLGSISACGGPNQGDGGFVEISSKGFLNPLGHVTTLSPQGKVGTLLLDPTRVSISTGADANATISCSPTTPTYTAGVANIQVSTLTTQLAGCDVIINTTSGFPGFGIIDVVNNITWSQQTKLTLIANEQININPGVKVENTNATPGFTAMDFQALGNSTVPIPGIQMFPGSQLKTDAGAISLDGQGSDGGTFAPGVYLDNSTIQSKSGNITLVGLGGNGTNLNDGIVLTNSSTILSETGSISCTGTGLGTTTFNRGIFINSSSSIQTAGTTSPSGNISLIGTGSIRGTTNCDGITLTSSSITSTTTLSTAGSITLDGTAKGSLGSCIGVNATSSSISTQLDTTSADAIQITGSSIGTQNSNLGIVFSSTSVTAPGNITVVGTGAPAVSNNLGISVFNSSITSIDGTITCTGIAKASGNTNVGLFISNSPISTTSGDLIITGTGSALSQDDSIGISLINSASINSVSGKITCIGTGNGFRDSNSGLKLDASTIFTTSGNISLSGTGSVSGSGRDFNRGIWVRNASSINSNSGTISCTGIGNGITSPNNNDGFFLEGASSITTVSSNITISGTGGGGSSSFGIATFNGQIQSTSGNILCTGNATASLNNGIFMQSSLDRIGNNTSGDITIQANNRMRFTSSSQIKGTGHLFVEPLNPSNSMGIGTGSAGSTTLLTTDLDAIQDGFSDITFGYPLLQTGTVIMNTYPNLYKDPLIVNGGIITVDTPISAGTNPVLFNVGPASGGTLNLNALVIGSSFTVQGGAFNDTFFININNQIGTVDGGPTSLSNTLVGPNFPNTWSINGNNAGVLNTSGPGTITFTNIQNLTGGTNTDDFTFTGAYQISGLINGSGGTNSLFGPNLNTSWTITGNNAGTIFPLGAIGASNFQNIQFLTGSTGADDFTFTGPYQISGLIEGGGGTNTLTGPNINTSWTITNNDVGTIFPLGAPGVSNFQNIQYLTGGSSADAFTFAGPYQITGLIDGGGGSNSLTGFNLITTWTITNNNAGNIFSLTSPGITNFQNIQNLNGGSNIDYFTFTGPYQISGLIDGGGGTNSLTGPDVLTSWVITATNAGTIRPVPAGISNFKNIQRLIGGVAEDFFDFTAGFTVQNPVNGGSGAHNTLYGPNTPNAWYLTGHNTGNVSGIFFFNITDLVGGNKDDLFIIADLTFVDGIINGGGPPTNTLDLSGWSTPGVIFYNPITESGRVTAPNYVQNFVDIQLFRGDFILRDISCNANNKCCRKLTNLGPLLAELDLAVTEVQHYLILPQYLRMDYGILNSWLNFPFDLTQLQQQENIEVSSF